MAEPTINYVHKTGVSKIFQDTANDKSIASAVEGTEGTLYTNIDSLATNANNVLMHDTYNPSKITPTNLDMFRGYPKPLVTLNYEVVPDDVWPNEIKEGLFVDLPTLNYYVGFQLIVTLAIVEKRTDTMATLSSHNETLTYDEGSTTPDSSTITPVGDLYQLNDNDPSSSYDVQCTVTVTVDTDAYLAETSPHVQQIDFTAAATKYAHLFEGISALSCAGTSVSPSQSTCYSYDSALANGSVMYTSTTMATPISNDDYMFDKEDVDNFQYGATTTGVISSYGECTS